MNDSKTINQAVEIISENMVTPVIYKIDTEEHICFVCFLNGKTPYEQVVAAEEKLTHLLNFTAVIMDIREFSECDRIDILEKADMIYCADQNIKRLFELSLMNDSKRAYEEKCSIVDRQKNCNSIYIS